MNRKIFSGAAAQDTVSQTRGKGAGLSLITQTPDVERFIRANIEIVIQLRKRRKHIIVDGRSTDNTLKIAKEYPRPVDA
jgi:hypothetical protein